jgi:hypothetical protein
VLLDANVLAPAFVNAPQTLALRLACAPHEAVLAEWPLAHQLFDLDEEVENRLDKVPREQQAVVDVPADSLQASESNQSALLGNDVGFLSVDDRAVALPWAYAKPEAAGQVVPFYLSRGEGAR